MLIKQKIRLSASAGFSAALFILIFGEADEMKTECSFPKI
jgi:hypothetical protein